MKTHDCYNTNTQQQTCGFPDPTERQMGTLSEQATESHRAFFIKRGLPVPPASRHYIPVAYEFEQPEPIEA